MPEEVPPNDEIFVPRLGPIRVRLSGPEASARCCPGCQARGTNRRVDYIRRVLAALGRDADPTKRAQGDLELPDQRRTRRSTGCESTTEQGWAWSTRSTTSGCGLPG